MTETGRNIGVGLLVILALTALGTLMVWFGEVPDWISTSEWTLRIAGVRDLNGVGDGTQVYLQGVEVGRIKTIEFRNPNDPGQGVMIVARIKDQYSIPSGALARVYGSSLGIGSGRIDIVLPPGAPTEPLPRDNAVIFGEMRSVLGEIIKKEFVDSLERTVVQIGNLAESAKPVMDDLTHLIERRPISQVSAPGAAERGMVANLSTVVERIDRLVAAVNKVLGDESVQEDVKVAVRGLKGASEELKATVEIWRTESQKLANNVNAGVDHTEANLDDSFRRLNDVLDHLDDAATNLASVTASLTQRTGTAGLVLHDPRLYESAVLAMDRLAATLLDIKALTGKMKDDGYITVGLAPNGFPKKKYPIPAAASMGNQRTDEWSPDGEPAPTQRTRDATADESTLLSSFPP